MIVDVDEPVEVLGRDHRQGSEEAQIDGLRGLLGVHLLHTGGILRHNRAQMSRGSIAQDDIGFPIRWICSHDASIVTRLHPVVVAGGVQAGLWGTMGACPRSRNHLPTTCSQPGTIRSWPLRC
ncbi:hypothetical protein GCM10009637_25710 [Brevibacterium luteolum]